MRFFFFFFGTQKKKKSDPSRDFDPRQGTQTLQGVQWNRCVVFFAHLLVARVMGSRRPLKRVPRERAPRKGGRLRNVARPCLPPPLQSALVVPRARSSSQGGVCAEGSLPSGQGGACACCSRPTSGPRMPSSDQRPRTAAKRMRTALCATPGGAPGHRGGGGRPAPRPDAPRPRESAPVGVATSGGTSHAAAGAHSTLCVAHSAAGDASHAGRSEPLDALSLAQRQVSDAPHRRTPTERTGPRACAHNAS